MRIDCGSLQNSWNITENEKVSGMRCVYGTVIAVCIWYHICGVCIWYHLYGVRIWYLI